MKKIKVKLLKRITAWIVIVISGVIVDEYIKEGYLFDPSDLVKWGTHENIVMVLASALICILLYIRLHDRQ